MGERLTWGEIMIKFPDRWVGLSDVEFADKSETNVKTAIVRYSDLDKNTLLRKQLIEDEDIITRTTYKY